MTRIKAALVGVFILLICGLIGVSAQTVYYQDGFSRSGELNGSAPDVANTGGNHWAVSTGTGAYSANGSTVCDHNAVYDAAYLPVNGSSGVTLDGTANFTLSATVTPDSTGQWYGISLNTTTIGSGGNIFSNGLIEVLLGNGYAGAYNGGTNLTYAYNGYAAGTGYTISLFYNASAGTITYVVSGTTIYTLSGVTAAQIASARVVAFGNGSSGSTATVDNFTLTVGAGGGSGGSAPAAPTGLSATAGSTQITLNWTASSGATSYNIYRGTSANGESSTAIATGVTATSYTNTGLTNGTAYYYKVAAVNSYGTSTYSSEVNATPVSGIPAAPTNLGATAGNTQVSLSWTASSGATSYNVYRGTSANGESATAIATGISATSYTNTGLTNGTTYYYKVAAVNASGTSSYSNETSATPTGGSGATTYYQDGFSRSGELNGSAPDITNTGGNHWAVSTGTGAYSTNGSAVYDHNAAYDAAYLPVNGSSGVTLDGTANFTLSATLTPDSTGQSMGISLNTATIGSGGNIYSNALAELILGNGYAGAFNGGTSLTYVYSSYTAGTAYNICIYYNASAGTITYGVSGSTVYTLSGITSAQIAALRAVALGNNTSGTTATVDNFTLTVGAGGGSGGSAPAAPTGLSATASSTQVSLSWTASSGATSYNVYRGTSSNGEGATAIATGVTATSFTNTGLTNGTTYYYKVAAVNTYGTSTYSSEVNATPTAGGSAPAAPTNLSATPGNTQVSLSWTASSGATSYNVYRGTSSNGESTTAIATGVTATSFTNTGLTNGTTYYYKVAAVNTYGTSTYSSEVNATPSGGSSSGNLILAVGLERIVSGYNGPAIRVRSSGGGEQDFGFASGSNLLDNAAVAAFLGQNQGWITMLYDQSGSGHNVSAPASTDNMPTISATAPTGITINGTVNLTARNIKEPYGPGTDGNFRYFVLPSSVSVDKSQMSAFLAFRPDYSAGPYMSLYEVGNPSADAADLYSGNWGFMGLTHNSTVAFSSSLVYSRMQPTVVGLVTTPGSTATLYVDGVAHSAGGSVPPSAICSGGYLMAGTGTGLYYGQSLYGQYNFLGFALYNGTVNSSTASSISNIMIPRTVPSINIVADGDSITQGTGAIYGMDTLRYAEPHLNHPADITNLAVYGTPSGNPLGHSNYPSVAGSGVAALYNSSYSKNIYYLAIGTNDIHGADVAGTGTAAWNNVVQTLQNAKTMGYKTIVVTVLHEIAARETATQSNEVDIFNSLLRNAYASHVSYIDAVVDYQADSRLGVITNFYPAYSDDGTHPNDAGYQVMGSIAYPVFNSLIGP